MEKADSVAGEDKAPKPRDLKTETQLNLGVQNLANGWHGTTNEWQSRGKIRLNRRRERTRLAVDVLSGEHV